MKSWLIILAAICPAIAFSAPTKTIFVPKFQCSPANKIVSDFSNRYILKNPSIPPIQPTERVRIYTTYQAIDGSIAGATGTKEELSKLPGYNPGIRLEQIARFAQFNSSAIESEYRIYRSFYDPKICKPSQKETCLWDRLLNVYQDATLSQNGHLAAIMSNADEYTPDILLIDLRTNEKTAVFTSAYQRPYETNGRSVGQVNFINDLQGNPRYLAYRDGGYRRARVSVTFLDLVSMEQVTIPREDIESLIGVRPNPTYPQYLDPKDYYSVDIEKVFSDVRSKVLAADDVTVPFGTSSQIFPPCPLFQTIQ